jgi:uncharacterized membrane protein
MLDDVIGFIGHFHPVFVHLPIGIFFLGIILKAYCFLKKELIPDQIFQIIVLSTAFFAGLSCLTGFMLSGNGDYNQNALDRHKIMGLAFTALSILLFFVQKKSLKYENLLWPFMGVLLIIAGHLGGNLTHGEDYLSFQNSSKKEKKEARNLSEALVYEDLVQPILEEKCYSCHASAKQKGGLRLDEIAFILKGGKHGTSLIKGNAMKSLMIMRAMLPNSNEEHMPPKGKPQLTEKELKILSWWINQNALEKTKISSLKPDNEIQLLLGLSTVSIASGIDLTPNSKVKDLDTKALKTCTDWGISILPIAKESNYLSINLFSKKLEKEQWSEIKKLAPNIVWFKSKGAEFDADAFSTIAEMKNLVALSVINTKISNENMQKIGSLNNLKYLNLSGSTLDETSIKNLKTLNQLQKVYLYKTNPKSSKIWTATLPKVKIDTGGYIVPTYEADTTQIPYGVK